MRSPTWSPGREPQVVAEHLVALALQAGSRDNVTAVIADVVDAAAVTVRSVMFAGRRPRASWRMSLAG
jgi:serine/threonine protein phosphatase PrpC